MKFYDFIPSGFRDMYFQSQPFCSDEVLDKTQSREFWKPLYIFLDFPNLIGLQYFTLSFQIGKDHGFWIRETPDMIFFQSQIYCFLVDSVVCYVSSVLWDDWLFLVSQRSLFWFYVLLGICIQRGLHDMEAMVEFWIIGCIVVMLVVGCHSFFL